MEPAAIKFDSTYRLAFMPLLGFGDCEVRVVERRGAEFFSVVLPNGKRETVHASDLSTVERLG